MMKTISKSFFRLQGGYIGAAIHTIRDGDVVVIFYSCKSPFILREVGKSFV
jgi:hypothetical protein